MNAEELKVALRTEGIEVDATYCGTTRPWGTPFEYRCKVHNWECVWRRYNGEDLPAHLFRNGVGQKCTSYERALEFMTFQQNLEKVTCWQGHTYSLRGKDGVYDGTCPRCQEYTRRYHAN